jgi:hypothetical protein
MTIKATCESICLAEEGMSRIMGQRAIPHEIYTDIQVILTFFRANDLHWIADNFEQSCARGNLTSQYMDIRVIGVDTVRLPSGRTMTKRDCEALIEAVNITLNEYRVVESVNLDTPTIPPVRFSLSCA